MQTGLWGAFRDRWGLCAEITMLVFLACGQRRAASVSSLMSVLFFLLAWK